MKHPRPQRRRVDEFYLRATAGCAAVIAGTRRPQDGCRTAFNGPAGPVGALQRKGRSCPVFLDGVTAGAEVLGKLHLL